MDLYLSDRKVKFPRYLLLDDNDNILMYVPSDEHLEIYIELLRDKGYHNITIVEKSTHGALSRLMKNKDFENTDKAKGYYKKNKNKINAEKPQKSLNRYRIESVDGKINYNAKKDKDNKDKVKDDRKKIGRKNREKFNSKKYIKDKHKINKVSKLFE